MRRHDERDNCVAWGLAADAGDFAHSILNERQIGCTQRTLGGSEPAKVSIQGGYLSPELGSKRLPPVAFCRLQAVARKSIAEITERMLLRRGIWLRTGRIQSYCCLNPASPNPSKSCRRCHSLHSNYMLNRGYAYTTIIGSKYHGQNLLSHLASLYPHSTPQAWQQRLNNGEVTLNGVIGTGSESVISGQTLVWNRRPWIEPDAPQQFEVLFDDPYLLAVNKPCGLPTLPGGGFMENTLLRLVQKHTPDANPVHRLGRATTGIVLFAKTRQAASNLFADWNTPRTQKIYRALAQNIAQHDAYEILTPLGLVPHPLIGSVWAANPNGKPSKSLAKVISRTLSTTTFEVSLNSGRPHQIRIHLASIGHPLVGDPLYGFTGQPLENLPGLPGDGGYFLHAQFLKFHHPITGKQINLEAALPSGFSLRERALMDPNSAS